MRKKRSVLSNQKLKQHKKLKLTQQRASERTKKGWRTKHLKYNYASEQLGLMPKFVREGHFDPEDIDPRKGFHIQGDDKDRFAGEKRDIEQAEALAKLETEAARKHENVPQLKRKKAGREIGTSRAQKNTARKREMRAIGKDKAKAEKNRRGLKASESFNKDVDVEKLLRERKMTLQEAVDAGHIKKEEVWVNRHPGIPSIHTPQHYEPPSSTGSTRPAGRVYGRSAKGDTLKELDMGGADLDDVRTVRDSKGELQVQKKITQYVNKSTGEPIEWGRSPDTLVKTYKGPLRPAKLVPIGEEEGFYEAHQLVPGYEHLGVKERILLLKRHPELVDPDISGAIPKDLLEIDTHRVVTPEDVYPEGEQPKSKTDYNFLKGNYSLRREGQDPVDPSKVDDFSHGNLSKQIDLLKKGKYKEAAKRTGWGQQREFVKEQKRRKREGFIGGTGYKGYSLGWGKNKATKPSFASEDKADIYMTHPSERQYLTSRFHRVHPPTDLEKAREKPPEFSMILNKEPKVHRAEVKNEEGEIVGISEVGETLQGILDDAGIRASADDITATKEGELSGYELSIRAKDLNPDKAELLSHLLKNRYGTTARFSDDSPGFKLDSPAVYREIHRRPFSDNTNKLPADVEENLIHSRIVPKYGKGMTFKPGAINKKTGERERDVIAFRTKERKIKNPANLDPFNEKHLTIGERAFVWELGNRSDAIGWGKDWRPGETEVNKAVTSMPRERYRRNLERSLKDKVYTPEGTEELNTKQLFRFIDQNHPNLDVDEKFKLAQDFKDFNDLQGKSDHQIKSELKKKYPDMKDDKIKKLSVEIGTFGAAATAAAYFSGTDYVKTTVKRAGGKKVFKKLPQSTQDYLIEHRIFNDKINRDLMGPRTLVRNKWERFKWRVPHPLADPDSGVAGIRSESVFSGMPFYARDRFLYAGDKETKFGSKVVARSLERKQKDAAATRTSIVKFHEALNRTPNRELSFRERLADRVTLHRGEAVLENPKYTNYGEEVLKPLHKEAKGILQSRDLRAADDSVKVSLEGTLGRDFLSKYHPDADVREAAQTLGVLHNLGTNYPPKINVPRNEAGLVKLPKPPLFEHSPVSGKTALIAGGAIAATAGSIYLYDRHRKKQLLEGKHLGKEVKTRKISIPSVGVQSRKVKVPTNTVTKQLNIANKEISPVDPTKMRIYNKRREFVVTGRRDISDEKMQRGLPLVGGVKLRRQTKGGSWGRSVAFRNDPGGNDRFKDTKGRGNVFVKGHELPVEFKVGDKVSLSKGLKSVNPNKLDQEERELLALMSEGDDYLRNFYLSDPKFQDIIEDPRQLERLKIKHADKFKSPAVKRRMTHGKKKDEPKQIYADRKLVDTFQVTKEQLGSIERSDRLRREDERYRHPEQPIPGI